MVRIVGPRASKPLFIRQVRCALVVGTILIFLGLFARMYVSRVGLLPPSPPLERFLEDFSLEFGLLLGILLLMAGLGMYGYGLALWGQRAFGPILEYQRTLRVVIGGIACTLVGLELFFASFVFTLFNREWSVR